MFKTLSATMAALALISSLAWAQSPGEWDRTEWFRFDINGNGKLDNSEWAGMQKNWNQQNKEIWIRFDLNSDGRLDLSERDAATQDWNAWNDKNWAETDKDWKRSEWWVFDTSGNGRLEDKEWAVMLAGWTDANKSDWAAFDLNRDGTIQAYEQRAVVSRWNAWSQPIWRKYDINGDGRLNENEKGKFLQDTVNSQH